MGQKINPIIYRLNDTHNWKSKYLEKKTTETKTISFKDIEIRNFITRFFDRSGISIHELKLSHCNNTLHVFISYLSTLKTISLISSSNKTPKIRLTTKKVTNNKYLNYKKIKKSIKNFVKYKKLNNIFRKTNNKNLTLKRIRFLKYYKNYLLTKQYKQIDTIQKNSFLTNFFISLSQFTNNQVNISLVLHKLNNDMKYKIKNVKVLKKNLVKLRKYENNEFFKTGLNVLFFCVTQKNSAMLLANFIANELKNLKRHNFFLRFIKSTLAFLNTRSFSKLKGIKIKIKGRFNKAPRARHKIIEIGNSVPTLTLRSKIDYFETTSFSSNSTFGVKVWICEKY